MYENGLFYYYTNINVHLNSSHHIYYRTADEIWEKWGLAKKVLRCHIEVNRKIRIEKVKKIAKIFGNMNINPYICTQQIEEKARLLFFFTNNLKTKSL